MLMINVVYLLAIAATNAFIQLLLPTIVQVPGDTLEWLAFSNLTGPSFWANIVALLSMLSANVFYIYGKRFKKVQDPSDVKGSYSWWLGLFVFPTLLFSVIAFVLTLPSNVWGGALMLLMYLTLGVGLYWMTTFFWSPPSVRMVPWCAGKLK